mgnify:CR=1 FL=1
MMLTTIDVVPGKQYEVLGLVKGNMVQTKNFGKDIGAGLKSLVGGELKAYSDMMNEARATATKRMVAEAEALGADAIVCVRYTSASVMAGAADTCIRNSSQIRLNIGPFRPSVTFLSFRSVRRSLQQKYKYDLIIGGNIAR